MDRAKWHYVKYVKWRLIGRTLTEKYVEIRFVEDLPDQSNNTYPQLIVTIAEPEHWNKQRVKGLAEITIKQLAGPRVAGTLNQLPVETLVEVGRAMIEWGRLKNNLENN
jgi:hypothetical protein